MDPELRTYLDETRRHFDVVAEGVRGDVRLVAEGVVSLSERVERVERTLREETLRSERELATMIKFSYADLSRKVESPRVAMPGPGDPSRPARGRPVRATGGVTAA